VGEGEGGGREKKKEAREGGVDHQLSQRKEEKNLPTKCTVSMSAKKKWETVPQKGKGGGKKRCLKFKVFPERRGERKGSHDSEQNYRRQEGKSLQEGKKEKSKGRSSLEVRGETRPAFASDGKSSTKKKKEKEGPGRLWMYWGGGKGEG